MQDARIDGVAFQHHESVDVAWLAGVWKRIDTEWRHAEGDIFDADIDVAPLKSGLPLTGTAVVKLCRRRKDHGLMRRLKPGRAVKEGRGYAAFKKAGIATPPLLAFGEQRKRGLHELGVVITARVNAETAARTVRTTGDVTIAIASAECLAGIHKAGLTHGDALLRNFLDVRGTPLPFDLPSCREFSEQGQRNDLERLLRSLRRTSARHAGDTWDDHDEEVHAVLARYAKVLRTGDVPHAEDIVEASRHAG